MELLEVLLLLLFVLFPLLQALLEKLGVGRRPELPPELEEPEERAPVATAEPPARGRSAAGGHGEDSGWSSGWSSWPSEATLEELTAEDVVSEEEAEEIISIQERLAEKEIPEAVRVSVPVVSMEALEIDRAAEHRRFHDRIRRPPPPVERQPAPRIEQALRRPAELRRAIILSEVLGPPRSLQPVERPELT